MMSQIVLGCSSVGFGFRECAFLGVVMWETSTIHFCGALDYRLLIVSANVSLNSFFFAINVSLNSAISTTVGAYWIQPWS